MISNASCPMGCGETLTLDVDLRIICTDEQCPRPLAAGEILSSVEIHHVVHFTAAAWTARHPVKERLDGGLMSCQIGSEVDEFVRQVGDSSVLVGSTWAVDTSGEDVTWTRI